MVFFNALDYFPKGHNAYENVLDRQGIDIRFDLGGAVFFP